MAFGFGWKWNCSFGHSLYWIELHSLTCKQKMEENFMNWAQNWWWSLYNSELILNNLWVLYIYRTHKLFNMEVWLTLGCTMHLIDKFPRRTDANASQKPTLWRDIGICKGALIWISIPVLGQAQPKVYILSDFTYFSTLKL